MTGSGEAASDLTPERAATNDTLFEEVRERARDRHDDSIFGDLFPVFGEFLCECGDSRCQATVSLTAAEFVEARAQPARVIVKPGHERVARERVVTETARFLLVERPAALARRAEPPKQRWRLFR